MRRCRSETCFQAKCYKKFEDFKAEGKTIIFVSHDISSVAKYCDRVILLNKRASSCRRESQGHDQPVQESAVKSVAEYCERTGACGREGKWDKKAVEVQLRLNPQVNEYGTGEAEIIDFAVIDEYGSYTSCIQKGTSFTIRSKVQFTPIFRIRFLPIV